MMASATSAGWRRARRSLRAARSPERASSARSCSTSAAITASVPDGAFQLRLRRGQPRDGHAVGRAGHVVEAGAVEEADRRGVAAVLAAHADLQRRLHAAALLDA